MFLYRFERISKRNGYSGFPRIIRGLLQQRNGISSKKGVYIWRFIVPKVFLIRSDLQINDLGILPPARINNYYDKYKFIMWIIEKTNFVYGILFIELNIIIGNGYNLQQPSPRLYVPI